MSDFRQKCKFLIFIFATVRTKLDELTGSYLYVMCWHSLIANFYSLNKRDELGGLCKILCDRKTQMQVGS